MILRMGRTSCVFLRVRDTAKSDNRRFWQVGRGPEERRDGSVKEHFKVTRMNHWIHIIILSVILLSCAFRIGTILGTQRRSLLGRPWPNPYFRSRRYLNTTLFLLYGMATACWIWQPILYTLISRIVLGAVAIIGLSAGVCRGSQEFTDFGRSVLVHYHQPVVWREFFASFAGSYALANYGFMVVSATILWLDTHGVISDEMRSVNSRNVLLWPLVIALVCGPILDTKMPDDMWWHANGWCGDIAGRWLGVFCSVPGAAVAWWVYLAQFSRLSWQTGLLVLVAFAWVGFTAMSVGARVGRMTAQVFRLRTADE